MRSTQYIDVLYIIILKVFIANAMSSYVETSFSSSEDPAVLIYSQTDVEKTQFSSEETELDKEIDAIQQQTCLILVADCSLYLKNKKFWYSEEHRNNICVTKIRGFQVCQSVSDLAWETAINEKEDQLPGEIQVNESNASSNEYRKGRLFYLKAKWKSMRIQAAEYGMDIHSNSTLSTTKKPESGSDSSSEES